MSLHSDLLKQARFLARKERKKPTQASLRRSVSASYCALFHLLVEQATRLMLPGKRGTQITTAHVVSPRREALDLADVTDRAFQDWKNVRGSLHADTFLTGLLAYKHMQG